MQSHRGGNHEVGWAKGMMSPGHSQAGDSSVWTSGLVTGPFLRQQILGSGEISTDGHFPVIPLFTSGAPGGATSHNHCYKARAFSTGFPRFSLI